MDSLTRSVQSSLSDQKKETRLVTAGRSFHIITGVYLYQMKHINKIAGIQGSDFVLRLTVESLVHYARKKKLFIMLRKTFLILTSSLKE